jgi:hypothetical protein
VSRGERRGAGGPDEAGSRTVITPAPPEAPSGSSDPFEERTVLVGEGGALPPAYGARLPVVNPGALPTAYGAPTPQLVFDASDDLGEHDEEITSDLTAREVPDWLQARELFGGMPVVVSDDAPFEFRSPVAPQELHSALREALSTRSGPTPVAGRTPPVEPDSGPSHAARTRSSSSGTRAERAPRAARRTPTSTSEATPAREAEALTAVGPTPKRKRRRAADAASTSSAEHSGLQPALSDTTTAVTERPSARRRGPDVAPSETTASRSRARPRNVEAASTSTPRESGAATLTPTRAPPRAPPPPPPREAQDDDAPLVAVVAWEDLSSPFPDPTDSTSAESPFLEDGLVLVGRGPMPTALAPPIATAPPRAPAEVTTPIAPPAQRWPSAPAPVSRAWPAAQPVAAPPAGAQPVAVQPAPAQPVAVQPASAQPVAVQPGPAQPVAVQPGPVQPVAVQPGPAQLVAVQPGPAQPMPAPLTRASAPLEAYAAGLDLGSRSAPLATRAAVAEAEPSAPPAGPESPLVSTPPRPTPPPPARGSVPPSQGYAMRGAGAGHGIDTLPGTRPRPPPPPRTPHPAATDLSLTPLPSPAYAASAGPPPHASDQPPSPVLLADDGGPLVLVPIVDEVSSRTAPPSLRGPEREAPAPPSRVAETRVAEEPARRSAEPAPRATTEGLPTTGAGASAPPRAALPLATIGGARGLAPTRAGPSSVGPAPRDSAPRDSTPPSIPAPSAAPPPSGRSGLAPMARGLPPPAVTGAGLDARGPAVVPSAPPASGPAHARSGGLAPTARSGLAPTAPGATPRGGLPAPAAPPRGVPPATTGAGLSASPRGGLPAPTGNGSGQTPALARPGLPSAQAPAQVARAAAPVLEAPHDPLAPRVAQWLADLSRAIRGSRLYADNNSMFRGFVELAFRELDELLLARAELRLAVHDDRLQLGADVVHQDADRLGGLPSTLFQSGLRTVVFQRGVTPVELLALIRTIGSDYSRAHVTGEDLITVLWRLAPPHFGYTAAKVLTKARPSVRTRGPAPASVEAIVAALSAQPHDADDVRTFLAGTPEEILAFERWYGAPMAELELMRTAALLNQAATHPIEREDFVLELERHDQPVELTIRVFDRLLEAVSEAYAADETASAPVLLTLYDALIEAGHYTSLASLVARLAGYDGPVQRAEAPERAALVRQLLPQMSSAARVRQIYGAYGEVLSADESGGPRAEAILALIAALGRFDAVPLFDQLDALARSPWRRSVLEVLTRVAMPTAAVLHKRLSAAKSGAVVCDLLTLTARLPAEQGGPLVIRAIRHPEAVVRAEALRLALAYDDPQLDALVCARLADSDRAVRLAALTLAEQRKGDDIAAAMDVAMTQDDFVSRDAEELRAWCSTLTALISFRAVPALSRLLQPTLLSRIAPSVEANLAALEALGTIDHPAARAQLTKALRSLNKTVRTAAKRALEQSELVGFRGAEAPPEDTRALAALPMPTRLVEPPTTEAFGHEVRGVLANLFGDAEDGPGEVQAELLPRQRRALPAPSEDAEIVDERGQRLLPAPDDRGGER